jgi:hypothetical protein
MKWSDLDLRPERKKLRQFSLLLLGFATGFALWFWTTAGGLLTFGTSVWLALALWGLAGALVPSIARPLFVGLTVLTFPIGWLVSRIVLMVIFLAVVTPIAFLMKSLRHDPLALRGKGRSSHWKTTRARTDSSRYLRQF